MSGVIKQEGEREALRSDLERELRRFVRAFEGQPEWLWSPATVRFVQAVRPKLELLGGPIAEAHEGGSGVCPEAAYQGVEDEDVFDEESDAA